MQLSKTEDKWMEGANNIFDQNAIQDLGKFILKLNQANLERKVFSVASFPQILSNRFLSTCLVNNNMSQAPLNTYMDLLQSLGLKRKMEPIVKLFSKGILRSLK